MPANKNNQGNGDPNNGGLKKVNWNPIGANDRANATKRQVVSVSKGGHTVTLLEPTWILFNTCKAAIKEAIEYGRDDDGNILMRWAAFKEGLTQKIRMSKRGTSARVSGKKAFFPTDIHLLQTTQTHLDVEKVMVDENTECLCVLKESARPSDKKVTGGKKNKPADGQAQEQAKAAADAAAKAAAAKQPAAEPEKQG